ncbi:mitochondrial intermediate [Nesidiocoris tenuis]|uniref:Mitochondrial intermediate n=1 Tax=Nesidiocoris tenuis TaxID=355587 RepID=A0ABN7AS62_9HEMI|nr:mitochondrial intermediate [Nesidiocoris tenuis]
MMFAVVKNLWLPHAWPVLRGTVNAKGIGTWSPLATAFNSKAGEKLSLRFSSEGTGLFGVKELATYDGFFLLKENVTTTTEELVHEICSSTRKRKIVDVFDDLSNTLCSVADLAEFVRLAHPHPSFSYAAENTCITLSCLVEKLNTNRDLYNVLKSVVTHGDKFVTNEVDNHVAALFLFDFEQCGIHLSEDKRQEVVALNDYILQLGQRFMAGSVAPRLVPKQSVPPNLRHFFSEENCQVVVASLSIDSHEAHVREACYKMYLLPDEDQSYLLEELLKSRNRLAQLCGFPTYAHRALKASLAENPNNAIGFLKELNKRLKPKVELDFKCMLKIKQAEDSSATVLAPWDIPYICSKAKREMCTESSDFPPYFSLGACMDGFNGLMQSLYGIQLVNEPMEYGESWANDVYKLAVKHETEGLLGHIYCDFYERKNKPNQDCHFTIRGGRRLQDGSYQDPIVAVMLNVPTPRWNGPSLLAPSMVDNLFHEMGHAMHSMLARTEHQHVTGTRCAMDFAEVPSVLMEYFSSDERVIRSFARHYDTKEPMPEKMLQQYCNSKYIFSASEMQMQVFYSLLDQMYHGPHPLEGSTTEILARMQDEYYGIPYIPNTAWQLRFSHLVGYGAKYYSYLMSRAVASSIWQNIFVDNPFSRRAGERYRRECLGHGGGKPPHLLVRDFLKIDPSPQHLADALINELDKRLRINL